MPAGVFLFVGGLFHRVGKGFAGKPSDSGIVSNCCQLSRSVVSASEQVGKHSNGVGTCLALAGKGGRFGAATVCGDILGKVCAQPASSSARPGSSSACILQFLGGLGVDGVCFFTEHILQFAVIFVLRTGSALCRQCRIAACQRGMGAGHLCTVQAQCLTNQSNG